MENENAKQKAIEAAYGIHWEKVKDYVDENGWIVKRRYNPFSENLEIDRTEMLDLENIFEYKTFHAGNEISVRPKSLSGIETNNNWISIHSEDDLPKEKKMYEFIPCNNFNRKFLGWVDSELEEVFFVDFKSYKTERIGRRDFTQLNAWLPNQITHYRELKNYDDKKPIY